jgi:lysyl-tRNA synthetase class 1
MPSASPDRVADQVAGHHGAALDAASREELDVRLATAARWLAGFAPERLRFSVALDGLPDAAATLSDEQRGYLSALANVLGGEVAWEGEALQAMIFDVARARELPAGTAFAALYAAFLGKSSGPRAGWLIASLERDFVLARLRAAAAAPAAVGS